jgi:hypothetical protein
VAAIVALVVALSVSGCAGSGDDDVATLRAGRTQETPASVQRQGADALYGCLTDAGLPATLVVQDDGNALIDWKSEGVDILGNTPEGGFSVPGKSGEFDPEVEQAFWDTYGDAYGLVIDGIDHSTTWQSCYESSGYTDPYRAVDPVDELKTKQAIAEVTNTWIACARENGMPQLEDVTAVADGWKTSPNAVIPLSTTVAELRELLTACPNVDEDQIRRQMEPGFNWETEYVPSPAILVEPPRGDDTARQTPPADSATESPDLQRYADLSEVLYAEARAESSSADFPPAE